MKLKELLIPNREGLEKKWWHRLAQVLIFTSTVVVGVFGAIIIFSDNSVKEYKYVSYSFESNYSSVQGEERNCYFTSFYSINCGDIYDSTDFLNRFTKAQGKFENLQQLRIDGTTDDQIITALIKAGKINDITVKQASTFLYIVFLQNIGLSIIIILGWFIFWKSIFYRSVLYIAFGKKK